MKEYPIVENHADLTQVVDLLLSEASLDRSDQGGSLSFTGMDPIRPTHIKVGAASASLIAANSIATAILWKKRTGVGQDIHVDLRKSYAVQSPWQDILANCTLVNGAPQMMGGNIGDLGSHILPTRDNRWVVLTSLYPSNTKSALQLLDCGVTPLQLERATRKWDAFELERAAQNAGVTLVVCRTREEYQKTEQYQFNRAAPLIDVEKIGDSAPEPLPNGPRPLSGLRVLGMTHVVAGPAVLRQLAAQGADCLNLNTLDWVEMPTLWWQCQTGMRGTYLDARIDSNKASIYKLAKEADVFVQNLRPHLAARQGFSPEILAQHRPGMISVEMSFNARKGPWADWFGYDFLAAGMTGLLCDIGSADQPQLPHGVQVVCDFLTGYLATIGVQAALMRRATEGGSYRVSVNLAQTVMFEQAIGLVDNETLINHSNLGEEHQPLTPNLQTGQTAFGEFTRIGSQVDMSETPEFWDDPMIHPMGSSKPVWLPR